MKPFFQTLVFLLLTSLCFGRSSSLFTEREVGPELRVEEGLRLSDHEGSLNIERLFIVSYDASELSYFRGDDGQYDAKMALTLTAFQGRGKRRTSLASRFEEESIQVQQAPLQSTFRWFHFLMDLPEGKIQWQLHLEDRTTGQESLREDRFQHPRAADYSWFMGSLWLLSEADSLQPDPLRGVPLLSTDTQDQHKIFVTYEIWSDEADTLQLESRIRDPRGNLHHERVIRRSFEKGLTQNLLELPIEELPAGDYEIEICLSAGDEAGLFKSKKKDKILRTRRFTRRWKHRPNSAVDLDRAVEQLRYLMSVKEYKRMSNMLMSAKEQSFRRFWQDLDPDLEVAGNPLMDEYYRRAEEADRRFAWSRFSGWRSDRGRIFMLYGEPDHLERRESSMDAVGWERWTYETQSRSYLFVDQQGFGDFQLTREQ